MNIDVSNAKEYDRMYEKDFLKFCKEYEFWVIVKSNNIKDLNKNKEYLCKMFMSKAKEHGFSNYITYDVFK